MAETAAIAVFFKVPYHPHQQKIRMTQLNSLSLSYMEKCRSLLWSVGNWILKIFIENELKNQTIKKIKIVKQYEENWTLLS